MGLLSMKTFNRKNPKFDATDRQPQKHFVMYVELLSKLDTAVYSLL